MADIDDIEVQLAAMEDKVEEKKQEQAQAEGAIKAYNKQLSDLGIKSEDEARMFVVEGRKELKADEMKIAADFKTLKRKFGW